MEIKQTYNKINNIIYLNSLEMCIEMHFFLCYNIIEIYCPFQEYIPCHNYSSEVRRMKEKDNNKAALTGAELRKLRKLSLFKMLAMGTVLAIVVIVGSMQATTIQMTV